MFAKRSVFDRGCFEFKGEFLAGKVGLALFDLGQSSCGRQASHQRDQQECFQSKEVAASECRGLIGLHDIHPVACAKAAIALNRQQVYPMPGWSNSPVPATQAANRPAKVIAQP
jgi:hypothetical protein